MTKLILAQLLLIVSPAIGSELMLKLDSNSLKDAVGTLEAKEKVRSDVLDYIHSVSSQGSHQEKALLQLALDYNGALLSLNEPARAIPAAKKILKSEFCVRAQFKENAYAQISKIHSLSLNTYECARLGIRLNTYMSKSVPYLPEQNTWLSECRFLKAKGGV